MLIVILFIAELINCALRIFVNKFIVILQQLFLNTIALKKNITIFNTKLLKTEN